MNWKKRYDTIKEGDKARLITKCPDGNCDICDKFFYEIGIVTEIYKKTATLLYENGEEENFDITNLEKVS